MNLLIAEDVPLSRRLLRQQLEAEGHCVVEACNGAEALAALERESVDGVISDVLMPVMDGFRLCLEIRRHPRLRELPFVLYTSTHDSPEDRKLALSVRADGYLTKPAPPRVILDALRAAGTATRAVRTGPAADLDDAYVLRQYNEALIRKLVERNSEIDAALTALKSAYEEARTTEARFRALVENGFDAVSLLNADGTVTYRSPAAVRVLGYSMDEWPRFNAFDLVHPDDAATARTLFARIVEFPEERTHSLLRYRHKDGGWRWLEGSGINLLNQPEIGAIVINYRDVTERMAQQQKLEKLARVRTVTSQIDAAIVRSRDRQQLFEEACRIAIEHGKFGIAWIGTYDAQRQELTPVASAGLEGSATLGDEKLVIREGTAQRASMLAVAIRERRAVYNNDIAADAAVGGKRRQEAVRRGYRSAVALPFIVAGAVFGSLSLFAAERDFFDEVEVGLLTELAGNISLALERMTQRDSIEALSRAREALAESLGAANERLRQIYRAMPGAVMVFDGRGAIRSANDAAVRLFGYPEEELAGRPMSLVFEAGHVPGAAEFAALGTGSAVLRSEKLCRNRAGERIPVLYSATRLPGAHGNDDEFICVALDVREQKQLEAELAQAQKLESVGRLAAGIAHEINTPIQFVGDSVHFAQDAMTDFARLIEAYQGALAAVVSGASAAEHAARIARLEAEIDLEYLRENVPRSLERVLDGVGRVASIVRAMKDFAHPDQKEMVPVDLNQAILNTLTIARNEYKYVAEVETDLTELPPVTCHPGEINQAILNVVVNAAHAIGEVVRDTERKGLIHVRTRREGDDVLVAISDTGRGIPEAIRSHIFDPFFTTKEVGRGTGQGLAIARSVVREKHGGELTFDTEPGKGTTFTIRLPLDGISQRAPEQRL